MGGGARHRQREREIFHPSVHAPNGSNVWSWSSRSQEPAASLGSLTAGAQARGSFSVAFSGSLAGIWVIGGLGLEPVPTQGDGIRGGGPTLKVTELASPASSNLYLKLVSLGVCTLCLEGTLSCAGNHSQALLSGEPTVVWMDQHSISCHMPIGWVSR